MIKRILPIYQTGWFYLIILFWGACYWFSSTGGLNLTNQANINILNKIAPLKASTAKGSLLTPPDILTLQSSFRERDVDEIMTVLSKNKNSQVTLLGNYSTEFIDKLNNKLSLAQRPQKVIIASNKVYSGQAIEIKSSMMFSELVNWFRFLSSTPLKKLDSQYLLYAPVLLNQKQSLPMLWQNEGNIYLSLLGEVIKQLSEHHKLYLNEQWQLSLENEKNTIIAKKLPLGFLADVYIAGSAYKFNQKQFNTTHTSYDFHALDDELFNKANIMTVKEYINQTQNIYASPPLYKAIFITDTSFYEGKIIQPLLTKISQGNYLYQELLTKVAFIVMTTLAFIMLWLIARISLKHQAICIISYCLVLFVIQYFFYKQQQWLEVQTIILLMMGTWVLLLGYQKEYHLFLNYMDSPDDQSIAAKPAIEKVTTPKAKAMIQSNTDNKLYKSPQNFSPSQHSKAKTHSTIAPHLTPKTVSTASAAADLQQTLVIVDRQPENQTQMKHHLTVENFGRYQVEGILGKGAMGVVYQGVDPKINRHVAIKTLQLSDDIDSEEFIEAKTRFFREAQTAGGLSHANIVTIYDVGEENNLGYIAMDLLTGAPLSLFTQPEQTLPAPLVYQLMIQITDALEFAHNQNVVHRDIKPANIIYDDDLLKVTVTDFGIAYVSDNSKTRTGIIMGSPYYMSPEQILGSKVDGRSDIFSLGVTFYQLLCGHLPFEGESIATVAYQITKVKAEAVNQRNSKLPASALRLTNKAMHKDIEKRYQTMAEFRSALVNALKRDFKISAS